MQGLKRRAEWMPWNARMPRTRMKPVERRCAICSIGRTVRAIRSYRKLSCDPQGLKPGNSIEEYRRHECLLHPVRVYIRAMLRGSAENKTHSTAPGTRLPVQQRPRKSCCVSGKAIGYRNPIHWQADAPA